MAARFWVGGTGNWDASDTTHWAASSGGAGGQSVPGASDDVTFDGSSGGGTVTVTATQSVISITGGAFTGTLNTNNQTITISGTFNFSGTGTRTLTLGSSAISVGDAWNIGTSTGLTVTANTATVTMTGSGKSFTSWFNANYNGMSLVQSGAGTYSLAISGSLTLVNYTRTGTAAKTDALTLSNGNLICTGTFTCNGNSAINRVLVQSSAVGTARTITAATVTVTNTDFQDITGAGAGSWDLSAITGGSGDCGGNSGITFTTSAAQTWSGTSGGNWSTNAWTSRVPLPQDDVSLGVAFSASQTVTGDMPRLGRSISWTGVSGNVIFSSSSDPSVFGSYTQAAGMGNGALTGIFFRGRGSFTITSAGISWSTFAINIICPGGTYTLLDSLSTGNDFNFTAGTFIDGGFSVSANIYTTSGSITRAITKTGPWTITSTTSTTVWSFATTTGLTYNDSSSITFANATSNSRFFSGGGLTYGTLTYTVAGSTGKLQIVGSNTFNTINFSDVTNARTLELTAGTTQTITGSFNVNGTSGKLMSITSATGGSTATISKASGTVSCDYLSITDSTATGGAYWYAGANSTRNTNVKGWVFAAAPTGAGGGGTASRTGSFRDMERKLYEGLVGNAGTVEDMKAKYFKSQTGASNPKDAERRYLKNLGASGRDLSSLWMSYLNNRGITGAYKEKLRKFYQGYSFSSDTPVPSDITGLKAWYKADAISLSNNDPVTSWTDSSGTGNTIAQGTGAAQPLYKTGGQNSKPYVLFDGTDDYLTLASASGLPTGTNGRTVIMMVENVTMDDYRPIYAYGAASNNQTWSLAFHTLDDLLSWGFSNDDVIATTASAGTPYILVHQYTGTNIIVRQSVTELANYVDTIATTGSKLNVGSYINESYFGNIKLYELMIFNTSLSADDRLRMEAYLTSKYLL